MSNLNPQQFGRMSMESIGDLEAAEHPEGAPVREWAQDADMSDHHGDLSWHRKNWDTLKHEPLDVATGHGGFPLRLDDGHHRFLVAQERGEKDLPVKYKPVGS